MITRLHIKNFKSLRELDLQLGPINVLVGPNMAGKSNILDVLRFLHDIMLGGRSNQGLSFALTQRGGVNEILWKGGKERTISLSLETGSAPLQPDVKYKYELQVLAGVGNQATIQQESLALITSGTERHLLIQKPGGFTQYKNAQGQEMGGVSTTSATALEGAFPTWDGYAFAEMIRRWRFYNLVPGNMKEPSKMVSGQVLEEPGGDNLSAG